VDDHPHRGRILRVVEISVYRLDLEEIIARGQVLVDDVRLLAPAPGLVKALHTVGVDQALGRGVEAAAADLESQVILGAREAHLFYLAVAPIGQHASHLNGRRPHHGTIARNALGSDPYIAVAVFEHPLHGVVVH
jgi:hypothetical protein